MASVLRLVFRASRPTLRPLPQQCSRRHITTSTTPELSGLAPEPEPAKEQEEQEEDEEEDEERSVAQPRSYREFIQGIGAPFKDATRPRNWLGNQVPFPMNTSFKPPTPMSDAQRTRMYVEFMKDPEANSVRVLSQKYHVSMKRVDAILRLKGMEAAWVKQKPLQIGFQFGMERILGVTGPSLPGKEAQTADWSRYDVHEADTLEEMEQRDAARQRYQRLYWESIPEDGSEPTVPASLEHAKAMAIRLAKYSKEQKDKLMPRIKDTDTIKTPKKKVQVVTKPGRPTVQFIDVGGKFMDEEQLMRRVAVAERRSRKRRAQAEDKIRIRRSRH